MGRRSSRFSCVGHAAPSGAMRDESKSSSGNAPWNTRLTTRSSKRPGLRRTSSQGLTLSGTVFIASSTDMAVNTAVNTVVAGAVACRKSSSTRVAPTAQLILKPARDSRLSPRSPPTARPCPGHCRGGPAPQTWATRPRGREAEHRYDVLLFQGRTLPAGPIGRLATTPWTSGVGPGRRRDPPSPPRLP